MNEKIMKLMRDMSEIRSKLNAAEPPADEADLRTKLEAMEVELRASLEAAEVEIRQKAAEAEARDDAGNVEVRPKDHPIHKVSMRNYLGCAMKGTPMSGAEAELAKELDLRSTAGVILPWEVIASGFGPGDGGGGGVEERADTAISIPNNSDAIQDNKRPIIARMFAGSVSAHLGVRFESAGVGDHYWLYFETGGTASFLAKGGTKDAEAVTLSAQSLAPTRMAARYLFAVEDLARVAGLETALRRDLGQVMQDGFDSAVLNGTGANNQPEGILNVSGISDVDKSTAVLAFADLPDIFGGWVDGYYAKSDAAVAVAVGPATFNKAGTLFQDGIYGFDRFRGRTMASAQIPAPPGSGGEANKQTAIVALKGSGRPIAQAPVWDGVELIRDIYTGAASGQIAVTATALWNFKVLETDAYRHVKVKVA